MARWHISLKTAAALAFLAVAAVPVWLAWEVPQGAVIELETERASEIHVAYTNAVAMSLKRYYLDVETAFGMLADDLRDGETGRDRTATLKTMQFIHICNFDVASGTLLGSLGVPDKPCPEVAGPEFLALIRALAVEGRTRFSNVMLSPMGTPMLLLARRDGPSIIVGALDTGYFRELADTIRFGKQGHAAIVDSTGRVLAHPIDEWETSLRSMAKVSVVKEVMAGRGGNDEFFSPAKEEWMASAFESVKGPGWGVLVNQPLREMRSGITEIKRGTLKVLLVALVVACALAMLAAHMLLDPIRRIRVAAERLGSGEGDALIAPTGAGSFLTEINDLRAAFNAMVLRIRRSHRTEIAARKEAQEATRTKSRFLANMSHELRTPLNAIIGFADVTRRRMTGAERARDREYLGYIHDSGIHLLSIINDLLDLSRIEAGAWSLDEEDVDVSEAIRDSRAMLGTMPDDKDISILLKGIDKSIMLWADRRAIRQMLLNLTTNAVRYTQEGGRVVIGCAMDRGGAVSLTVEDNGPGIEAAELAKIRAPFTRGHAHEMAAIPGTGLGLSIVDALAELHGARFELTSAVGKGTRAKIIFPPSRTLLTLKKGATRTAAQ